MKPGRITSSRLMVLAILVIVLPADLPAGIIPMEEKAWVIASNYIRLGGPVTLHPMTIGEQEANGHHVTIENPSEIADFIYINCARFLHTPANK